MDVVLLRHGTAVPHGFAGLDDGERPLVAEGEREARAAGRALKALRVSPGRFVTSPLVRARQTAQLAAAELDVPSVEDEALKPGFSADDIEGVFARHDGDCIVLVGHDPDLSQLVHALTGARVSLAKGGLARIDYAGRELRWLFRPRALRLIAKEA